jgi:putative ABC transport system substrate-binding protein
MMRMAVLHHGSPGSSALARFRAALHRHGLIDGGNCVVDVLGAEARWARLPDLTRQLLQHQPDVLVAIGAIAALTAQRATSHVPILHAIVVDPLDIGLTAAHVTGVSSFDPEQAQRHLRLLQQLLPGLRRIAFLTDVDAPTGRDGRSPLVSQLLAAAAQLGLDLHGVELSGAAVRLDLAFEALLRTGPQALVALEVPTVLARLPEITALAEHHHLPTLTPFGWSCGGLVMEGTSLHDALDPLAEMLASLSRGESLGTEPVTTARHPRLMVRTDLARRFGLSIPAAWMDRATCR